jgi:hypothetical protein
MPQQHPSGDPVNDDIERVEQFEQHARPETMPFQSQNTRPATEMFDVGAATVSHGQNEPEQRRNPVIEFIDLEKETELSEQRVKPEMIILGTKANLVHLKNADTWYASGSLHMTPKTRRGHQQQMWESIYTIHAYVNGSTTSLPLVYALMPKKTSTSFKVLLQAIIDLTDGTRPKEIVTDFEPAMVIAVRRVLPATRHRGCLFHFRQTCAMRIRKDEVMRRAYTSCREFECQINELLALALVPPEHVVKAFDTLKESFIFKQWLLRDKEATTFADYFECNFIGKVNDQTPETRGDPRLFPIAMWNYYDSVRDQSTKNNDAMKKWHYRSLQLFTAGPPSLSDLFRFLKVYQIVHTKYEIENAETLVCKRRGMRAERLSEAVKAFPAADHDRCLRKHIYRLSFTLPSLKRHIVPIIRCECDLENCI